MTTSPRRLSLTPPAAASAPEPAAARAAPERETVTLATSCIHAGQDYPAGATLTVDAVTAAWLRRVGAVTTPAAQASIKE